MLTQLFFALTLTVQCPNPPTAVRTQADSLVREANRSQGPRRSTVNRLAQRILALCPSGTVPVPVPPGPTPPPDPIVLPTPTSINPGSLSAPGEWNISLTPSFTWDAVSGATGYVVAIKNTATNAFVYPSTTGVGTPIAGTSLTLPAGVLTASSAYSWDVTAVNATSKSLPSANRYFTTAAPPPPTGGAVSLTATRDTVSMPLYPNGHYSVVRVTVRDANGVSLPVTLTNLTWSVSGDSTAVTSKRNSATDFEVHSPTRSGTVTVTARWTATGATASRTIVLIGPAVTPTPPPDTTTPPTPTPTPPPTGSPAELPRVVPAYRDPYPGRACSVFVAQGGDVSAALSAARGGSVVCLTTGTVYSPVQLPARATGDTGYIVLRTATTLPPEGTRIRPSTATNFAKILITRDGEPAFTTTPGTFGWFVRGIEIAPAANVTLTYALVELGSYGALQNTMAQVPQRLILSQVWIHGTATGHMQRCVYLNSGATAIVDSWFSDCHGRGQDTQAIGGINGPGPHLVRNNYLEGVGENILWGGGTPSIAGLTASDITIQRNHVYTPLSWRGVWLKKNLLELKNAVRVLIEDNVFDGSWTDGQTGNAILFKSINDQGTCNWCRTTDVTFRRNLIKNAETGIVFSGQENYNSFGRVDSVAKRFLIQDVVFDKLNTAPTASGWGSRSVQITGGASDIVFERTLITGETSNALNLDVTPSPRTAFRNSVWSHGFYFAAAPGIGVGLPSMNVGLPGFQWTGMTVVRGQTLDPLPAGTVVVTAESQAPLAAAIRATVTASTAGVVVPP